MYDPLAFPYTRSQTYVDGAAPAVLSGDFYNPVQDTLAHLYGGFAGYSTLVLYEEFVQPVMTPVLPLGADVPFGRDLQVVAFPGWKYQSVDPTGPNQYGVYQILGAANGDRGGSPGLKVSGPDMWVGTLRWVFRARVSCSNFSPLTTSPPGLVVGTGVWNAGSPLWAASSTGFWIYQWDGGFASSSIPTVPGQWVTLWITVRDGDGKVRWYLKRDSDPAPVLVDTRTMTSPDQLTVNRVLAYQIGGTAVASDNVQVDNISLVVER